MKTTIAIWRLRAADDLPAESTSLVLPSYYPTLEDAQRGARRARLYCGAETVAEILVVTAAGIETLEHGDRGRGPVVSVGAAVTVGDHTHLTEWFATLEDLETDPQRRIAEVELDAVFAAVYGRAVAGAVGHAVVSAALAADASS